jgi:hypothetical protein
VDKLVALHIRRLVYEPGMGDAEEAFEVAVTLVENSEFQRARQNLFDWEDRLFVDGWNREEAEKELLGLQEAYRDAVRAHSVETRLRWVSTLLPKAAEKTTEAMGQPILAKLVGIATEWVLGRFVPIPKHPSIERHPGAAMHMIRAAYRERETLSHEEASQFVASLP